MSKVPQGYFFSKTHEWARVVGELVEIGITDHAQSMLGDIVYLELPEPGSQLEAGQQFGVVESVKTLSDLMAPISGEVVEVNQALADAPEQVNADPYEAAWFVRIRPSALQNELAELLDSAAYEALAAADEH
ncbi:MAG: glycine cleavage system protein GcvH [Myxococcota bacterium]|jgi:glycine cleavage system H protein|nr:glycine cleavage system protein GcvH [Myxococcota bacterium]